MSATSRPPGFTEARNPRQKARAAGLHPDYWYAVEYDRAVQPGRVVEIQFWKTSIALYRGRDGQLRALENRCAHRQLKLSAGDGLGIEREPKLTIEASKGAEFLLFDLA